MIFSKKDKKEEKQKTDDNQKTMQSSSFKSDFKEKKDYFGFIKKIFKKNPSAKKTENKSVTPATPTTAEPVLDINAVVQEKKVKTSFFKGLLKKKPKKEDSKKKNNGEEAESLSLAKALMKKRQKQKIVVTYYDHLRHLKAFLEKAGFTLEEGFKYLKGTMWFIGVFVSLFTLYLVGVSIYSRKNFFYILIQLISVWIILFALLGLAALLVFFIIIDLMIYNRKKQIEEVLPDYLQLTSANVAAGMPIDQALWMAVRPRFGVLAKEIESVAKATLSGEDLKVALQDFGNKYDSVILKRSISILIEGIDAGGKIGPLLDKIGSNIQETNIFKKEMAANVTTYVIFITFASVLAAPGLFALSSRLLIIITNIMSKVSVPKEAMQGGMNFSLGGGEVISIAEFKLFIVMMLIVTTLFSAMIVSTIKKGNVRDGLKYLPIFVVTSIVIYFVSDYALGLLFSGLG